MTIGIIKSEKSGEFSFSISDGKILKMIDRTFFDCQYFESIYLVSDVAGTMVYDITVPTGLESRNIESVLLGELEYRLPVDIENVVWGYLKISAIEFKILAMRKDKFEHILSATSKQGITCDFVYPASLLSKDGGFGKFIPVTMNVPKELKPVRHRASRMLYALLILFVFLVCGFIFFEKHQNFQAQFSRLRPVTNQLNNELKQAQSRFGKLSTEKELLEQITAQRLNLSPILPDLLELTKKLPDYMWVTNYLQNGEMLDITIEAGKDEPNFYRLLADSKRFKIVNLRKSRGANETVIFYLKLKGGIE